mmetsp:Transcript_7453/g.11855  ORF Transcript_7453/g.11855 Transcript_7453/m.11855 type:complete len:86 (-) Transcript_7453:158-415(-)
MPVSFDRRGATFIAMAAKTLNELQSDYADVLEFAIMLNSRYNNHQRDIIPPIAVRIGVTAEDIILMSTEQLHVINGEALMRRPSG